MEVILLDRISKKLNGRKILHEISFVVERGDIFGYLGPNGAGKTTTIRALLGLFHIDSGILQVLGNNIDPDNSRRRIGFVLEADGLYENLSAYENLDFYCQAYNLPKTERARRIYEVISRVKLQDRPGDKVSTYSKGMRQKLALARALVHHPELLILDEPTTGVDPNGQQEVRNIILELVKEKGTTIFFSSHNLYEVERICNRIAVIDRGQIKACGRLDALKADLNQEEIIVETIPRDENITEELDKAVNELRLLPYVKNCLREIGQIRIGVKDHVDISEIVSVLSLNHIEVNQVRKSGASLEDFYARVVNEAQE